MFDRIVAKYGWQSDPMPTAVRESIILRRPLVRKEVLSDISDLEHFFVFAQSRLELPDSYAGPLDVVELRDGFIQNLVEPIKSASE